MIRAIAASLVLASTCLAVENSPTTNAPEAKQESKPARFKLPSVNELSAIAGDLAQKLDSKLVYLEQGVVLMKPAVDNLAQPANAKIAEKYTLLTQSLPPLRVAVNALKSGKVTESKADLSKVQENLKTAESLFTQLKGFLPQPTTKTTLPQAEKTNAK